jgi:hypothetical protein
VDLALADVNGDGLPDMLVADSQLKGTWVFLNQSTVDRTVSPTVSLGPQQDLTGMDFILVQTNSQVSGRVFQDLNRDGRGVYGEPGLAGATVYVDLNRNG